MHLLELRNIGKIYASDNAIAVGIRGVNLSFDLGEFVAITGQSGSGKSTLLNIISGMDSYEEGEMYIDGETTSHYVNEDWEIYREKYISFIFQDYNIIDSFTVLENVELALLHIQDKKERRKRAKELIKRVGLESHMNHRGSHLSGGQKQRTVIARALAKDSPIILADEPTGNLDSQTSKEIIDLLKEISKNKLVIIVTHNFDEVASCATRQIRIFDGAIKSDRIVCETSKVEKELQKQDKETGSFLKRDIKNGLTIAWAIFKSKPRLSLFLCALLIIASACVFLFTGVLGKQINNVLVEDNQLFNDDNGRVVVTKRDGSAISDEEVKKLADKYNADTYEHCDILNDTVRYYDWNNYQDYHNDLYYDSILIKKNMDVGEPDIGRYPQNDDECLVYIPYSLADLFGKKDITKKIVSIKADEFDDTYITFNVVGVKYYTDNNKIGYAIVTENAYNAWSAAVYMPLRSSVIKSNIDNVDGGINVKYSFEVDKDKPVLKINSNLKKDYSDIKDKHYTVKLGFAKNSDNNLSYYDDYYDTVGKEDNFENGNNNKGNDDSSDSVFVEIDSANMDIRVSDEILSQASLEINPCTIIADINNYIDENYAQCSLFFEKNSAKKEAIEQINKTEYIAIDASMKIASYSGASASYLPVGFILLFICYLVILFLVRVVGVCTRRSVDAFKDDVGIMRSMGIKVKVIKIAVYVRMLLAMIAPVVFIALLAIVGYRQPLFSAKIMFMYPIHYMIIFAGLLIIVVKATKAQVKRLFSITVKKALKKGEN